MKSLLQKSENRHPVRSAGFQTCCIADFQVGATQSRAARSSDKFLITECHSRHPPFGVLESPECFERAYLILPPHFPAFF
jgi:hypothetical protein